MTLLIFDTQRGEWLDLDVPYPEPKPKPLFAVPHTCAGCGAYFRRGKREALHEHHRLCRSWMSRVPAKDGHGNTVGMLGDPDPVKLARHVQLYGREGARPWLHLLDDKQAAPVIAVTQRRSKSRRKIQMARRFQSTNLSVNSRTTTVRTPRR